MRAPQMRFGCIKYRNPTADKGVSHFMIGETFVDGQGRDVWCNSKKPITDMKMHYMSVGPFKSLDDKFTQTQTCYNVHFTGVEAKLILYGDMCPLTALNNLVAFYFICE